MSCKETRVKLFDEFRRPQAAFLFDFGRLAIGREGGLHRGAELSRKPGDGRRVLGFVGEVGQLLRVRVVVIKFATLVAFVPFGIAPARRAKAVAKEAFTIVT